MKESLHRAARVLDSWERSGSLHLALQREGMHAREFMGTVRVHRGLEEKFEELRGREDDGPDSETRAHIVRAVCDELLVNPTVSERTIAHKWGLTVTQLGKWASSTGLAGRLRATRAARPHKAEKARPEPDRTKLAAFTLACSIYARIWRKGEPHPHTGQPLKEDCTFSREQCADIAGMGTRTLADMARTWRECNVLYEESKRKRQHALREERAERYQRLSRLADVRLEEALNEREYTEVREVTSPVFVAGKVEPEEVTKITRTKKRVEIPIAAIKLVQENAGTAPEKSVSINQTVHVTSLTREEADRLREEDERRLAELGEQWGVELLAEGEGEMFPSSPDWL